MATASPKAGLRPLLPSDTGLVAAIFRASVEDLTVEDYDEDQRNAWAAAAEDEAAFGQRLAGMLTLVATLDGSPAAFAALKGSDRIEMLYCFPAVARQGLGTLLVDALERLGRARGAKAMLVDASDTAKPLFEARGYRAQQRNMVPLNGEWLANTSMEKRLDPAGSPQP